jgi:hypothetical protein
VSADPGLDAWMKREKCKWRPIWSSRSGLRSCLSLIPSIARIVDFEGRQTKSVLDSAEANPVLGPSFLDSEVRNDVHTIISHLISNLRNSSFLATVWQTFFMLILCEQHHNHRKRLGYRFWQKPRVPRCLVSKPPAMPRAAVLRSGSGRDVCELPHNTKARKS